MTDSPNMALDHLLMRLSSKSPAERQEARKALVRHGSAATPHLVRALKSAETQVRWEAAKSLLEIGDAAAAEPLADALSDEDPDVRWVVGEALSCLGAASVHPVLTLLTRSDRGDHADEAAHPVLHELAKQPELAAELAPVLDAFHEPERAVAISVAADKVLLKRLG